MNGDFILIALLCLGFPDIMVNWIKVCITSPKFLVAINGELVGFFGSNRGLRQGDPISPYFFIIAMVVFFGLFHKVVTNASFKFHAKCKKPGINHLYFADDIM